MFEKVPADSVAHHCDKPSAGYISVLGKIKLSYAIFENDPHGGKFRENCASKILFRLSN